MKIYGISALSLNKKQSSTYNKYACGCFLCAPSICIVYFKRLTAKRLFRSDTDVAGSMQYQDDMFLIAGRCGVLILSGYNKAAQKRCPFCFHKTVSLYAFSQDKSCKNAVIEQPPKFIFCSAVQFIGPFIRRDKGAGSRLLANARKS